MAVLGAATAVAATGVPRLEEDFFELLNGGPDGLEYLLWVPMQVGSLFGPFVVGGVAWRQWRRWRPALGSVVAGVVAWQLAKTVKTAVERGRPFEELGSFAMRAGTPTDGLGFVSGHSAVAFAVAGVCSPYLRRRGRMVAYSMATLTGLARIQVSAHLPLDVVGGAALGYCLAQVWNLAVGVPATEVDSETESGSVDPGRSRLE